MSRAGNLVDRVAFYSKVITRDIYGASQDTWPYITISTRGELRNTGGNYALSNEEKFYSKGKELTVRYRSDIVETMRVQINNTTDTYIINYMEILGRNESLRLTLEKINNEMVIDAGLSYSYLFDTTELLNGSSLI